MLTFASSKSAAPTTLPEPTIKPKEKPVSPPSPAPESPNPFARPDHAKPGAEPSPNA